MALTDTTIPPIAGIDDPAQARVLLYQAGWPVHAPLDSVGLATDTEMAAAIEAAIDATATAQTRNRIVNGAFQIVRNTRQQSRLGGSIFAVISGTLNHVGTDGTLHKGGQCRQPYLRGGCWSLLRH